MADSPDSAPKPPEAVSAAPQRTQGAAVRVRCDNFTYDGILDADDNGEKTVKVRHLGDIPRERLV